MMTTASYTSASQLGPTEYGLEHGATVTQNTEQLEGKMISPPAHLINKHVHTRYVVECQIGQGAYGKVFAATDLSRPRKRRCVPSHKDNDSTNTRNNCQIICPTVAIKHVPITDPQPITLCRLLRETKCLRMLQHENVIRHRELVCTNSTASSGLRSLEIVSDLMESNLSQIIRSHQALTDTHVQFFTYQILRALKYIHSANLVHRDIKPSNCLVNTNCDLRLCDFGLARYVGPTADKPEGQQELDFCVMSDYVATRWYRPPEIVLGKSGKNTQPFKNPFGVDIWAVGCILAELMFRRPLFPGRDQWDQYRLVASLGNGKSTHQARKDKLQEMISREVSPLALDLLTFLLHPDPLQRPSAADALQHPYLAELHDPTDEPVFAANVNLAQEFDFEHRDLSRAELFDLLRQEAALPV